MIDDNFYMNRCLELGVAAGEKGNPAVGSLIVKNGEIIAEAEEAGKSKNDITCHAEIEALRAAVKKLGTADLSGCILYTTHEPCVMCSYAIRFYKIEKVVYRVRVDYFGGISSSVPVLSSTEVPSNWSSPPEIVQLKP